MTSALQEEGVAGVWDTVEEFVRTMREAGEFEQKRKFQHKLWMWNHIDWELTQRLVLWWFLL